MANQDRKIGGRGGSNPHLVHALQNTESVAHWQNQSVSRARRKTPCRAYKPRAPAAGFFPLTFYWKPSTLT
jgi:hypothetical protein